MSAIDDYLKRVDSPQKEMLERVRKFIKQTVPDAEEVISYGIPGYTYKGNYLIGYAAFKNHLSLFPTSHPIEILKEKLDQFKIAKGTIQFTVENSIPEPIIKELITIRKIDISK